MAIKLLIFLGLFQFCEASEPILFGHNLSPTAETIHKGDLTVGTYYIGLGLTEDLTFGTSPWMMLGYNLQNIIFKLKHPLFGDQILSHQLAYFNSDKNLGSVYDQKSMAYWMTYPIDFDRYKLNITMNYMYFWNEKKPFSLRREPFNRQAQQITLSTLNQFYFSEKTILQFELGILGVNYTYPNLSAGASWVHIFQNKWTLQIGGSISRRFGGPYFPDDMQSRYIDSYENYELSSIHPEIQIQYWF